MITLKKVDSSNLFDITALTVFDEQKSFVATNTVSILEAYTTITAGFVALPFGIYDDETLVGFVMFGHGSTDENDPEFTKSNYCIWRFMIDKNFQGKGLGKKALKACLDYIKTWPCGEAKSCWLSYEPENLGARALYNSIGFKETGDICEGEIVSILELNN